MQAKKSRGRESATVAGILPPLAAPILYIVPPPPRAPISATPSGRAPAPMPRRSMADTTYCAAPLPHP